MTDKKCMTILKDYFNEKRINWNDVIISRKHIHYKDILRYKEFSQLTNNPITNIDEVSSPILNEYYGLSLDKKGEIDFITKTGMFEIVFKQGEFITITYFKDVSDEIVFYFSGLNAGWKAFLKLINEFELKDNIPPVGFCDAEMIKTNYNGDVLKYRQRSIETIQKYHVIHPKYEYLQDDVAGFFNNFNPDYKRFNEPYIRKILLTGEQGTGKTSMIFSIAMKYIDTHNICIISDIQTFISHMIRLTEAKIPSIVILEDSEQWFHNVTGIVLNFLSGIYQPLVLAPAYVIFTSNHPEKIDDNILSRPGRIDEIMQIDALHDDFALQCARFYFKDLMQLKSEDKKLFDKLTGVQIKTIARSVMKDKISGKKVDIDLIKQHRHILMESLKKAKESAERRSLSGSRVGFNETPY